MRDDIKLRQLISRSAPQTDHESLEYLVSVLMDQEQEDFQETIPQFIDDRATADQILQNIKALSLSSHEPEGPKVKKCDSLYLAGKQTPLPDTVSNDEDRSSPNLENPKEISEAEERRNRRETKKFNTRQRKKTESKPSQDDFVDDDVSAWNDRLAAGKTWGGRGYGGRGIRGDVNTATNIHLSNITLQFAGNELLQNSTIQINGGHRYGLVGRNGVGKSTLLRRLADHAIPGIPHNLRILLVKQQVEGSDQTALEVLMNADQERVALEMEQADLEDKLNSTDNLEQTVERLTEIATILEACEFDQAEVKARKILKGLQFSEEMMVTSTEHLSGGWRMRLALAQALFVPSHLLLLDEPTNHLDLYALAWLTNYLLDSNHTIIVVSHDRTFLDVCTDIITFEHKKLKYHPGNYSAYELHQQDITAHHAHILDASERQKAKALAFVKKQEGLASKKNADPKKQRQAKMIKEKKLDRIGNYREDGKKYKNFSLAKLSEDAIRLSQKVHIDVDEPVLRIKFPPPMWSPGMTPKSSLIKLEGVTFGYDSTLLEDVTLDIQGGSKIAVCGRNGAGKTSLLKLITGEINSNRDYPRLKGEIWRHQNLRIGHVTQYSIEELEAFAEMTVVEYAEQVLSHGTASCAVIEKAGGNVRQYLGSFGLGGKHAHRLIGNLSGGERMRLCFSTVLADKPQFLVLDEPTNHLDIETMDALSAALDDFRGAVIIVSHNQSFLSGFCNELWAVQSGQVDVRHLRGDTFDRLFSNFRSEALMGSYARSATRQANGLAAKKAARQREGTRQGIGLIP